MNELQTIIKWYDVREVLPDSSREILACSVKNGRPIWMGFIEYSFKHDAFNACDHEEEAKYAMDIDYWAEKPRHLQSKEVANSGYQENRRHSILDRWKGRRVQSRR